MSVEIDWQTLLEDSEELNNKVRGWLDRQFKSLELPPYIKDLSVTSFDLGDQAPAVTIKHIGDPFDEFYDDDNEEVYDSGSDTAIDESHLSGTVPETFSFSSAGEVQSRRTSRALNPEEARRERDNSDGYLHYFLPHLRSSMLTSIRSPVYSPVPNRTSTPLSSSVASPVDDETSSNQSTKPSTSDETTPEPPSGSQRDDDDIQLFLEISYTGNMKLGLVATLLLNYPSPNFISLPLKLTVTGLQVHVLAVLAIIKGKFHFSVISDCQMASADSDQLVPKDTIDIIQNVKIGSEIGDESSGSVLRNVGKVEAFLLEKIRDLIRDELAWPGWITVET